MPVPACREVKEHIKMWVVSIHCGQYDWDYSDRSVVKPLRMGFLNAVQFLYSSYFSYINAYPLKQCQHFVL